MESLFRDIDEYGMEGEIPARIMITETDENTKVTNKIDLDMLYQAKIAEYIKKSKEFKKTYTNNIEPYFSFEINTPKLYQDKHRL